MISKINNINKLPAFKAIILPGAAKETFIDKTHAGIDKIEITMICAERNNGREQGLTVPNLGCFSIQYTATGVEGRRFHPGEDPYEAGDDYKSTASSFIIKNKRGLADYGDKYKNEERFIRRFELAEDVDFVETANPL